MNYKDFVNVTESNGDLSAGPRIIEDAFFVLDIEHPVEYPRIDYLVFTDYCFTTTGYYVEDVSPDGKIAVFGSDKNIILMNLETGNTSHLSDWSFIGWAR